MAKARSTGTGSFFGVLPANIFLLLFFIAPFVVLLYYSLLTIQQGNVVGGPSFEGYVKLLSDPFTYYLYGRTIGFSVLVTLLCLILGYPVAYLFTKIRSPLLKSIVLVIVTAPLLTSSLVLSFGWIIILGKQGILNKLLISLGLLERPISFS